MLFPLGKRGAEGPDDGFGVAEKFVVQEGRWVDGEVPVDDGVEFGVFMDREGSAGEGDDLGDEGVGEGVVEDGGADEACGACEDEFHFLLWSLMRVRLL